MTREVAAALVAEHGGPTAAARAILLESRDREGKIPTVHAVRMWIQDALRGQIPQKGIHEPSEVDRLNKIKQLLDDNNIDISSVGRIRKVRIGKHRGLTKNKDGQAEYHDLPNISLELTPAWEEGPKWPLVQPAAPTIIKAAKYVPRPKLGKTIVVLPDAQIGYLRSADDPAQLEPMHDLDAIDVALQIVADLQPDQLGWIGDFLDLSEMSRWLQVEEFWRTTQPAIDEGHRVLAQFEAAAGPMREQTWFVAGNHDRRFREYVQKNSRAAFNIRRATETPENWPALTIPWALELDKLNIEYCGEYPGSEKWITPNLIARHNPEKKDAYDASVIAGHTHRLRMETFTHRTMHGTRDHTLYEIGCLCRIDNYRDKRSLMATSVPSDRGFVKDWMQGLAIIYVDDDGDHSVELVKIRNRNGVYKASLPSLGRTYATEASAA